MAIGLPLNDGRFGFWTLRHYHMERSHQGLGNRPILRHPTALTITGSSGAASGLVE
jgi:hypothetical protein